MREAVLLTLVAQAVPEAQVVRVGPTALSRRSLPLAVPRLHKRFSS